MSGCVVGWFCDFMFVLLCFSLVNVYCSFVSSVVLCGYVIKWLFSFVFLYFFDVCLFIGLGLFFVFVCVGVVVLVRSLFLFFVCRVVKALCVSRFDWLCGLAVV